jgi:chromosome segregation ATPase|tara:strand:+ start:480 stop:716 length:237 start_codon:yes stop_codon:yes gene_type:complete
MLNEELNELKDTIRKRSETFNADWTPFIQNVEDVLEHIKLLSDEIDRLSNDIGETQGMIKNLRKILIKLEVIDDRFIF